MLASLMSEPITTEFVSSGRSCVLYRLAISDGGLPVEYYWAREEARLIVFHELVLERSLGIQRCLCLFESVAAF